MVHSMTGFGKAEGNVHDKLVSVEIKSLNSKGLDINIRMPGFLRERELLLRNQIVEFVKRGKVDVYFNLEMPANKKVHTINEQMVHTYAKSIREMSSEIGAKEVDDLTSLILRMPNVLEPVQEELTDDEWSEIEKVVKSAIDKLNGFRAKEGEDAKQVFVDALKLIEQNLHDLQVYEPERAEKVKERLEKQLENISDLNIDENRLEQELIYYIEKYDISEEKSRLTTHISHFRQLLEESSPLKGKKLGFVSQELGREINTIGSKANHAEIQRHVVVMKDNLEQIKEQLANVL